MTAYSPKAKRVGKKLREIRECIGMSQAEAGLHLGVEQQTVAAYESGRILPGREMQRRFILTYFGKWSWKGAPAAPAVQGAYRGDDVMAKVRLSPGSQKRLDELCKRFECSAGAAIELAIELLHDNQPVITTLKEAGRRYEDLRWRSILEANSDIGTILDADPIMARIAHEGLKYTYARDKMLDPKFLMAWLDRKDEGAYMKVANINYRPVRMEDRLEEIK